MDALELAMRANAIGVKLEMVNGLPIWEGMPSWQHQETIDRIRESLPRAQGSPKPGKCACLHKSDIYIRFPDGSFKRPDVAVFCREPAPEERRTAVTLIPEAVIEVISEGYEVKDIEIGPSFYLMHGVKDVIVFNPATGVVSHIRKDGRAQHLSPVVLALECGCTVTV
jgi:Uma2 family endonuclease